MDTKFIILGKVIFDEKKGVIQNAGYSNPSIDLAIGSKLPSTAEVPNSWNNVLVPGRAAASRCAVYFWQLMAAERGPVSAKATTWHALLPYRLQ